MAIERYNKDGFRIDPLKEKINKKLIELTAEYLLKVKDEIDNYEQTTMGCGLTNSPNIFYHLEKCIKDPSSVNMDVLSSFIRKYGKVNDLEEYFGYKGEPTKESLRFTDTFFKEFGKKKDEEF